MASKLEMFYISDLCSLIHQQILNINKINNKKFNVGGGRTRTPP